MSVHKRFLEFTKKPALMSEKVESYTDIKDLKKGARFEGLVVGETEHGYIVKTVGGLKGLLGFADIKENKDKLKSSSDLSKAGTLVKTYVLFTKKAKKSIALTLNKKKAKV